MRLSQSGRQEARSRVLRYFDQYRKHIHPNPFKPKHLYWFAWTADERAALEMLKEKHAIVAGNEVTIRCKSLAGKRPYLNERCTVKFSFGGYRSWPYPDVTMDDDQITDPELRSALLKWVVKAKYLDMLHSTLGNYSHALLYGHVRPGTGTAMAPVNTPGQMYRIWPEFASLVEKRYRDRVAGQKMRSSLPEGVTDDTVRDFREQEYMEELNTHLLAIPFMMDDFQRVEGYPRV